METPLASGATQLEWVSVARWVKDNFDSAALLESEHLDELGIDAVAFADVEAWKSIFSTGVQELKGLTSSRKFLLVVPLGYTNSLVDGASLTITKLCSMVTNEPPSVYLQDPRLVLQRDPVEEYKFPLDWEIHSLRPEQYQVYFRQFRTLEDIENGWEYACGAYLESFP